MPTLRVFDGQESYPNKGNELIASWIGSSSSGTVTAITSMPSTVNAGAAFNVSGTVKTSAGVAVSGGTVQMQYQSGSTWVNSGSPAAVSGGSWTRTGLTQTSRTVVWRAVFSGSGVNLGSTSTSKTVTALQLTTYTKTYACTGSASYQSDGDKRSGVTELYQGYYSSTNGNQRSVASFNDPQIRTDLSGATITKVELYLNALHWGDSGGGTAVIGTSPNTGIPGSNPPTGDSDRVRVAWSSKNGAKWCTLPNAIGNDFKSGAARAILLGPGPTTSTLAYYGYFAGNGQTGEPQLRITYQKYA